MPCFLPVHSTFVGANPSASPSSAVVLSGCVCAVAADTQRPSGIFLTALDIILLWTFAITKIEWNWKNVYGNDQVTYRRQPSWTVLNFFQF